MNTRVGFLLAALALAAAGVEPAGAQEKASSQVREAEETLVKARDLYAAGSYQECRDLVVPFLRSYEAKPSSYPPPTVARLYRFEALLAYTFREEGYAEEVTTSLTNAVMLDLDMEIGDPAEVPAFVIDKFTKVKSTYLARFSRTARRSQIGVFWALVLEATVWSDISVLQPGVSYTFNISDSFALDAQMRFPLRAPIWNSIRGQAGLLYFPSSRVEKIYTGLSLYYIFGLDDLVTYTHSLSFGGRMEFVTRSGIGFAGNAELLRADLVFGSQAPAPPPSYAQIPFLGLGRIVFANITLSMFYAF